MKDLNPKQQAAAKSNKAITIVFATPGSGKTRTLIERVKWLIANGANPKRIACVSYTNAAANEIAKRLGDIKLGCCSTLHALIFKLLQRYGQTVGLPNTLSILDEEAGEALLMETSQRLRYKPKTNDELRDRVSKILDRPSSVQGSTRQIDIVATEFLREQIVTGDLGFDHILHLGLKLLHNSVPACLFDHILWDEVNDSAEIDIKIMLGFTPQTLWVCGDFDQQIMSFRGSNPAVLMDMANNPADYVGVFNLNQNYRSLPVIVLAASHLIEHNQVRVKTDMRWEKAGTGRLTVCENQRPIEELSIIAKQIADQKDNTDIAVLWRTNIQAKACREHLQGMGIAVQQPPQRVKEGQTATIGRAMLAFMCNPWSERAAQWFLKSWGLNVVEIKAKADSNSQSVASMYNGTLIGYAGTDFNFSLFAANIETLSFFQGPTPVKGWMYDLAKTMPPSFTVYDLLESASSKDEDETEGTGVYVGTIHSAKGREWDMVIMGGCDVGVPAKPLTEEDRRLFYVGATRPMNTLVLTWCNSRPAVGRPWLQEERKRIQFISEMGL